MRGLVIFTIGQGAREREELSYVILEEKPLREIVVASKNPPYLGCNVM